MERVFDTMSELDIPERVKGPAASPNWKKIVSQHFHTVRDFRKSNCSVNCSEGGCSFFFSSPAMLSQGMILCSEIHLRAILEFFFEIFQIRIDLPQRELYLVFGLWF